MSANKYEQPLTGTERYRDQFQILYSYSPGTEQYHEATQQIYTELEHEIDVSKKDQIQVLRELCENRPEQGLEMLEEVLE